MNEEEIRDTYEKVLAEYGVSAQVQMLIGECSELIQAACETLRYPNKPNVNFLEELGDVEIMIAQMRLAFDRGGLVECDKIKKLG